MNRNQSGRTPRLIVFDLDFTLWDCGGTWCDCLSPPFHQSEGKIQDQSGRHIHLYEDVHPIFDHCDSVGIAMALASRTEQPRWAIELVERLSITHRFVHAEIYPSSKLIHLAALRDVSGIDYHEMIFFDDEMRNIREVSTIGVHCVHVAHGITARLFHESLAKFSQSC